MLRAARISSLCRPRFSTSATHSRPSGPTGSAKLFEDAAREEAEEAPVRRTQVHERLEEPNWDGDERVEDTVRTKSN